MSREPILAPAARRDWATYKKVAHVLNNRAGHCNADIIRLSADLDADEELLRQALDTLAYWLEHGETPGSHDMIQRTHDALQGRLR